MLEYLEILNGSITPQFNTNIFDYDVYVDDTVFFLDLKYNENIDIVVYGNEYLTEGESRVLIEVFYNNKVYSYNLIVHKPKTETVFKTEQVIENISLKDQIISDIKLPLISSICFVIIVITFTILFRKK